MKLKYEIKILRRYRQPKAQAGAAKVWALGGGATGGGGRIRHTRFNSVCGIHKLIREIFCS